MLKKSLNFKSLIKKIYGNLFFLKNNYIIFESYGHFYDNSYFLFKYLSKFKKLKLFYVVYSEEQYTTAINLGLNSRNIIKMYSKTGKRYLSMMRNQRLISKSSLIFICYRNFIKEFDYISKKKQKIINLKHSQSPIKDATKYYKSLCFNDKKLYLRFGTKESYDLLPEKFKELNFNVFFAGMPRNDCLHDDVYTSFSQLMDNKIGANSKIILWMTTFRGNGKLSFFENNFPIKFNISDIEYLEKYLEKHNLFLLIKIHHENIITTEDLKLIDKCKNIIIKSTDDFFDHHLYVNQIFQYTNALVTDYSSTVFDYLYINNPVGFAIGDIDKYIQTNGFMFDYDILNVGPRFKDMNGLIKFLNDVINNIDIYSDKRKQLHLLFNNCEIGNNCKEVAELFINKKCLID